MNPVPIHRLLWERLSAIETINERVRVEQFHGWAQYHLRALEQRTGGAP